MIPHYVFMLFLVTTVRSYPKTDFKYWDDGYDSIDSNEVENVENAIVDVRPKLSTPEECNRVCTTDEKPRHCYYHFTMEHFTTMGTACNLNNGSRAQCIEADGFERVMLSINRMLPGPSIQVCQNDKVIVDVHNAVDGSEVTLHWHGVWQQGSQYYDGVPFVTQCPITSGTTFRYQFVASNPGTHFYHSHSGLHKIDGQYGSLIVRQPKGADPHAKLYDADLPSHVVVLSDWMHEMSSARFPGRHPNNNATTGQLPNNVLINGRGQWKNPTTNVRTSVRLETFDVQPGKRYRFRLINSFSSVCPAQLTVENHVLQLVAQDGESVESVPVNTIITSSGERVDFVLNANNPVGAYWIQVRASGECNETMRPNQVAILRYAGGPAVPKTERPEYNRALKPGIVYNDPDADCENPRPTFVCADHLMSMKHAPKEVLKPQPDVRIKLPYRFHSYRDEDLFKAGTYSRFLTTSGGQHVTSLVDGISFSFPRVPPLSQKVGPSDTCVKKDCKEKICTCPHTHHIKKGAVVEVIVYDEVPRSGPMLAHPFHLHGYAFHLLKIGQLPNRTANARAIDAVISEHEKAMKSGKHTRPAGKDTISVTNNGYVIFRFKADNPGWWLFHCHFLYHVAAGMSVVFHVGEVKDLPPVPPMFPTCYSYTPEIV